MSTPLEQQIATARQHGYSDEEIQSFLQGSGTRIGDVVPQPARPEMGMGEYTAAERGQLEAGVPIERQIDRGQGADFMERIQASFKFGPRGRTEFYKEKRGAGNVVVTPDGQILLRDRNTPNKWHPADEEGLSMGDVADFAGDIPGLVAMGAFPMGAGLQALLRAGMAAGGGEVAKQLVGALLPGGEQAGVGERAGSVALSAAGGAAAQAPVNLIAGAAKLPQQTGEALKTLISDVSPTVRQRGLELEQEIGGQLLPSQLTGSRNLALTEGFLRRNPFAAEKMANVELERQMVPVQRRAEQILTKMSGAGSAGAEELGTALRETMREGIERAWSVTNAKANADFGVFRGAQGQIPSIQINNYVAGLKEIIQKFGAPEFGAQANSVAKQAKAILKSLGQTEKIQTYPTVSASKLQDMMRFLGQSAYGRAPTIFKDVPVPFSREIAQDLHKLLRADLSVAADTAGEGSMAALLKQARSNYETNIKGVHELQNSLLSRYLGRNPEQMDPASLSRWFLTQKPNTIKATLEMLGQTDPSIANLARSHVLERALEVGRSAAQKETAKYGVKPGAFGMEEFLKNLPADDMLTALYGAKGQTGTQVRNELQAVIEFVERATSKGAAGSIQTPGPRQLIQIAKSPFSIIKYLETFGAKGAATMMTDPVMRKAFIGLASAKNPIAARKAAEVLERVLPPLIYELGRQANPEADPNVGE